MDIITEKGNLVNVLVPASAALNTPSDIVNVANYHDCTFLLIKGAGAVGTGTVTVDVCDTVAPGNTAKCAYKYRRFDSVAGTWGALTDRTSVQSFATDAQAGDLYEISVNTDEIGNTIVNNARGNHYVRLCLAQVDATAVLHAIVCVLGKARYGGQNPVDPLV